MDDLTRITFVLYPLFLQPDPLTQTQNKFDAATALAVFITEHVPLLVAAWAAAGGQRGDYRIQSSGERD